MAVAAQTEIETRRYSGWLDPRYPIGYWQQALSIPGDATGGSLGISLLFQSALTNRLNSQMYSVERFSIATNDSTTRIVRIAATNMGGTVGLGFTHEYAVSLQVITGLEQTAVEGESQEIVPWFLGAQRTPAITASLNLLTENVNLVVFRIEAEGYIWSARSVMADGGPQRPPTGPYRR